MRSIRVSLFVALLVGVLIADGAVSVAWSQGSELTQAVSAETSGEGASIALESVDAFPAEGGDAIFAPGTAAEERFQYARADYDTDRLVGLVRPDAAPHDAGVFVEPLHPVSQPDEPPQSSTEPEQTSEPETGSQTSAEPAPSGAASSEPAEPLCDLGTIIKDNPCLEFLASTLLGLVNETIPSECGTDSALSDCVAWVLSKLDEGGAPPCGPDHALQDCVVYVIGLLGLEWTDPCDPENTGRTCVDYLLDSMPPLLEPMCDIWFPSGAPQQTVLTVAQVEGDGLGLYGDAAAYCPGIPGPITLIVCLETGPTREAAVPVDCLPFSSGINRVDGYAYSVCAPGKWWTYAEVSAAGGMIVEDDHSGVAEHDCVERLEGRTIPFYRLL